MATKAQIRANRENAKKSTGPRTNEGKQRSAQNPLKHGLLARDAVLPGEDPADFDRQLCDFEDTIEPKNALEFALVRQIADAEWRMRRLTRLETGPHAGRGRSPDPPGGPHRLPLRKWRAPPGGQRRPPGRRSFRAACFSLRSPPSPTRENKTNPIPPNLPAINGLGPRVERFSRRPRCGVRHHACRVTAAQHSQAARTQRDILMAL